MGGFVILDGNMKVVIQAGRQYGSMLTNNKAESFSFCNALDYLAKVVHWESKLPYPV